MAEMENPAETLAASRTGLGNTVDRAERLFSCSSAPEQQDQDGCPGAHGLRGWPDSAEIVAEHELCRPLRQAEIDGFVAHGVAPLALHKTFWNLPDSVFTEDVVLLDGGGFEFARYKGGDSRRAFVIPARDEFGDVVDLVAWDPFEDELPSWLGRAPLLGTEHVSGPRLTEGLPVHPDPLSWLRAHREGVVIVDPAAAAPVLRRAEPLIAASVEHGKVLSALLAAKSPLILVPSPRERASV